MKFVFVTKEPISKNIWEPVQQAALSRGHETLITADANEPGDVGFYCDDESLPGKQNFTVISINGLDQDHVIRPNYEKFFLTENWNLFDLGFLPGEKWFEGLVKAADNHSCAPRLGAIKIGWPKSDKVFDYGDPLAQRYQKKNSRIILYAPQTEQDGKQSQVVQALLNSDYELWVKHWETEDHRELYPYLLTDSYMQNLSEENIAAENTLANFRLIPPDKNFMEIVVKADLLITDQSSVIYEAALCGVPTLTVKGWRHACGDCTGPQPSPDVTLATDPNGIRAAIDEIFDNYIFYVSESARIREENFVNLGVASEKIVESIEKILSGDAIRIDGFWENPSSSSDFYSEKSIKKRILKRKIAKMVAYLRASISGLVPREIKNILRNSVSS